MLRMATKGANPDKTTLEEYSVYFVANYPHVP